MTLTYDIASRYKVMLQHQKSKTLKKVVASGPSDFIDKNVDTIFLQTCIREI